MKLTIYSTPTCIYCHALMDWLDHVGVKYEEKDTTNEQVKEEASDKLGYEIDTVPTSVIGDDVIVGFNRPAIKRALKKHGVKLYE